MEVSVKKIFDIFSDSGDPRVSDYLLMQSSWQPIFVVTVYLIFIYKVGPDLMKNKAAYDLKRVMLVYNFIQVVFNVIVFVKMAKLLPTLNPLCTPPDSSNAPSSMAKMEAHHYYTLLKFFDLIDTIFFVFRKKQNQISFLHVHHHVGILAAAWISGKYFPGGHALYVGFFNTFVHGLMYGYYFMTVWDPENGKSFWWKKHLTQLQIVQHYTLFTIFLVQILNSGCTYPKVLSVLFLCNVAITIHLFTRFYKTNYGQKMVKVKEN